MLQIQIEPRTGPGPAVGYNCRIKSGSSDMVRLLNKVNTNYLIGGQYLSFDQMAACRNEILQSYPGRMLCRAPKRVPTP